MKYFRGQHTKPVAIYKPKNTMRKINDYTITTAVGYWLDFADQISCPEDIDIGMTALISDPTDGTVSGSADGDYVMPNGGIFVFVKGTLKEMKEPVPEPVGDKMITAIRIKGETYHWIVGKKKFMRVVSGVRLSGKLYVPGTNGKYNVLVKDQTINRSPGKPILGI